MPFKNFVRNARERAANRLQPEPEPPADNEIQQNAKNIAAREEMQREERRRADEASRQEDIRREGDEMRRLAIVREENRQRDIHNAEMRRQQDERRRIEVERQRQSEAIAANQRAEQQRRQDHENVRREQERKRAIQKEQNCSRESVGRLRKLLRDRYRLDVWIWSRRRTPQGNQHLILKKCEEANDILQQIYAIVSDWDEPSFRNADEPDEWKMAEAIKKIVEDKDQHVDWVKTPPWAYKEDGTLKPERS